MKKMKKSIFIMILVVINILVCIMPVAAASSSVTIDGFAYSIDLSNAIVTIEGCTQSYSKAVEIPSTITTTSYGELPVLVVGSNFLGKRCKHETVKIPEYVALIDLTSFYNCKSLKSIIVDENNFDYSSDEYGVLFNKEKTELLYCPRDMQCEHYTIPESVTSIGYRAFAECTNLRELTIGENVEVISTSAFFGCTNLQKINWNAKKVSDIEAGADPFYNCGSSNEGIAVVFGDGVECIPGLCFSNSKNVKTLSISNTVKTIGEEAFYGCSGITNVTIGNSVETIGRYSFSGCSSLTEITIPDSVTSIGYYAFSNCANLVSATIGDSIETISSGAFSNCTSLKNINIPESVEYIATGAFSNSGLEKIVINGKKCVVEYNADTIPANAVIYGHKGSPAQLYAQMYGRDFVALAEGECEHTYSEWIIDADATCTQRGFAHRVCALCNGYEFDVLDETGHSDEDSDNCCDVCDTIISVQRPDTGDNNTDNEDSGNSGTTSFLSSITEFFNKLIAWIKSLFGMA